MSKGSRPRPVADRRAYAESYEAIFGKERSIEWRLMRVGPEQKCSNCNYLREKNKFGEIRRFCRYAGNINWGQPACDKWAERDGSYSSRSTIKDYG